MARASSTFSVAGFSTKTCAPASSAAVANRKCDEGGVVTWTTSGRSTASISRKSVYHFGIRKRSAAHSAAAAERSQTAVTSTSGSSCRQARCCRAICPAPTSAALIRSVLSRAPTGAFGHHWGVPDATSLFRAQCLLGETLSLCPCPVRRNPLGLYGTAGEGRPQPHADAGVPAPPASPLAAAGRGRWRGR